MPGNKKPRDPIPANFKTLDEFDEFWSTHSLADYDDLQRDVHFNIQLDDEKSITLKPPLARALRQRARQRKVSVGALVNQLLEEQLKELV
jgi:predicted DNA-binding ribbon-helix-helix protein